MGWLWLIAFALGVMLLVWRLGMPRELWSFLGAALMLGAAGYALQGNPTMPDVPARPAEMQSPDQDRALVELRREFFGRFNYSDAYFIAAEAMQRSGKDEAAVQVMLSAINGAPKDAGLWTGLGNAYVAHDAGQITPAARLAFTHAIALAPQHPGPPFFYGLALIRTGRLDQARTLWQRALALSPAGSQIHHEIALRLAMLEQAMRQMVRQRTN